MIGFLLKFLGVKVGDAQEVTSVSLQLRQGSWLGWAVSLALLLAVLTWWVYRYLGAHRDLARKPRVLLSALRLALYLLILFMLLRPVFSFTVENRIRRTLIALIDQSSSMDIQDARLADPDVKRAAIAKGMIQRIDQSLSREHAAEVEHLSRQQLLASALNNQELDLLETLRRRYDLTFATFDRTLTETTEHDALAPAAADDARQSTALGDALREIVNRKRGQPVAGIFVITDGANNLGSEPLDAARFAGQEKMPLYLYGVGITSPRDIVVSSVFAQDVAFIKDELPVTVRLRAQGLVGQQAKLVLKLDGQEVAAKDLTFTDETEEIVPLAFTPDKVGEYELTASIAPRDDETVKDNNAAAQRVRVIDSKIKVLLVERVPRWEYRYLFGVLLRDRRIDAKFLLADGDPELSRSPNSPYIAKFPATKEELFTYDLVIIGDYDPKKLGDEQMGDLAEFVSKFGGACAFIAGPQFNPTSYRGTPLEKMLPVEWESALAPVQQRPTTLTLTPAGRANPMLRLTPEDAENAAVWKHFPPVQWIRQVSRAKPGAQVLLEDSDPAKMTRFGKMPALVLQQYGVGQVLFLGTDDTWRWRQEEGVALHPLLWSQIVQRMALEHLLGGSKRTQLSSDKQRYVSGERVTVFARLYDQNFAPLRDASAAGSFAAQPAAGATPAPPQAVQMRAVPDQPGMYRGDFVVSAAGGYLFSMANDPKTVLPFSVSKPQFELGATAMNEPLLKEMARLTGGAFFREETLSTLPETISQKDERISRVIDADLWSSPFYFLLMCGLVTTEWIVRKKCQLK
ncbi:MAG TPA: hypothetical protein VGO11_10425 [Chthoniobacteraceae bacterium]|jgi:hypothetical protein|nr:hypothetical protein [Chthoniobacteraceae bacterium]